MDEYTREIMSLLKSNFKNVVGVRPYRTESELQSYWLKNYEDNLIHPMDANAMKAYDEGAGKEVTSGKIGALKSSSAMTYNLFWDQIAEIDSGDAGARIGNGVYKVEFEKKLRTVKSSLFPAHLDAFLYCKHTGEAVACEMKMTEWIFNRPGMLRASYLNPDNYFDHSFGSTMVPLAKELAQYDSLFTEREEYPCRMERYDAFQMFKHVCACYTACLNKEPGEIRKMTLVNCAWTLQNPTLLSVESCNRYISEEQKEHAEFDQFKRTMVGVKKVFADIGVDFDICFYTFDEFLSLLKKTTDELNYLRRYNI